ncbi:MAG: hypothetical protein U9N79_11000 [Actinomycetota bacterium]|nr:hypothetical protein [Actinomycetota bacterium]
MRRVIVIVMATALFLSVTAGIAGAAPWEEKAVGGTVSTNYAGLTVDLAAFFRPEADHANSANGQGQYYYQGNAYRLRVTAACFDAAAGTVTAWGPAVVTAGSFKDGMLVRGDRAYGVLSLRDSGDGSVSARAGIAADFFVGGLATMVAEQCGGSGHSSFPATGTGELDFTAK